MLYLITSPQDTLIECIKDDPVRPQLTKEFRTGRNKFIATILEPDNLLCSVVCVSLHDFIPQDVEDLEKQTDEPNTAIFYTIWSYKSGSGAVLLRETVNYIKQHNPKITNFITLSPKTEMAKRFHLKNGAIVFRENTNTVNYQYLMI